MVHVSQDNHITLADVFGDSDVCCCSQFYTSASHKTPSVYLHYTMSQDPMISLPSMGRNQTKLGGIWLILS